MAVSETPQFGPPGAAMAVAVLMGGPSREREVSLASGRAVAEALAARGHAVRALDVRPGGVTADLLAGSDVAFLALHGAWGEDGGVQRELEALGVPYTGSGPQASALAMDKVAAKERFAACGVPTPAYRVVARGDERGLRAACEALGPGVVVKPVADGSSIHVALCDGPQAAQEGAEAVWADDEHALVERRIAGRELTVGLLGETPLPVLEICVPGGWYDYHMKYESGRTEYVFEHGLAEPVEVRVIEAALAAHRALGCRDLSRVDLMLTAAAEPLVLEVNTTPGFTGHSLVPKAAGRAGIPFPRLCERLTEMALARAPEGNAAAAVNQEAERG